MSPPDAATPLEVLLAAMRWVFAQAESGGALEDYRLAAALAEKAAPYVHARLGGAAAAAAAAEAGGHEAALAALAAALEQGP